MNPVIFEGSNKTLQPTGEVTYSDSVVGISPLPIWTDGEQCVSCWSMSWRERLSAVVFGRVWVAALTGQIQPPMCVLAEKNYFDEK